MTRIVITKQDGTQQIFDFQTEIKNVEVTGVATTNEWAITAKDTNNSSTTIRLIGGRERRG